MINISDLKHGVDFFKSHDNFTVVIHCNADGDTIGSATALVLTLRKLGKKAVAFSPEPLPDRLRFITVDGVFEDVLDNNSCIVSVDVASMQMLGGYREVFEKHGFDFSIDHHVTNTVMCNELMLGSDYSSNAEIIYELIIQMGVPLDKDIAKALYCGMSSDSGSFRYSSTRPETYEYAAQLIRTGIDFAKLGRMLFDYKSRAQVALEGEAYKALEFHCAGRVALVAISEEIIKKTGVQYNEIDVINQIPRCINNVEVSAILRPRDGEIRVSLRSNDYFDVAKFAQKFGGGGHLHAAGCRFLCGLDQAKEILIKALEAEMPI